MKFYEIHQGLLTKSGTGDFYHLASFNKLVDALEYFDIVKNDLRGVVKQRIMTTIIVELDNDNIDYEEILYEFEKWTGGKR